MPAPDFSAATVASLAKRAAQTCSNPICRRSTSGPHSDDTKSIVVGEAAHIRGARSGSARFDSSMSDAERAEPSNGIWLCNVCAKLIDSDPIRFSVDSLYDWKRQHEAWVEAGRPTGQSAAREIIVTGGGLGGLVENQGPGIGLEVQGAPGQTAERIEVVGRGIGEIVTNTGPGTGKVVRSVGAPASESRVTVNQPVKMAAGLISKMAIVVCDGCRTQFRASKVVQGFAGDEEPKAQVKCPNCGRPTWV